MRLSDTVKSSFKDAAKKLTGNHKRDFMAKVAEDYFDGSVRQAELFWDETAIVFNSVCTNDGQELSAWTIIGQEGGIKVRKSCPI